MPAKILVVDDDRLSSKLVQRRLEEKGYTVILASTGTKGIEKCFAEMPNLVIMDLQLPDIDGYQAIQVLKNDGRTSHIPIIMLTASVGKRSQYWGMKTGADDFLTKPFAHNDLTQRIEALLSAQKATGKEPAVASSDNAPVPSQNVILKVNQILDRKLYEATVINDVNNLAKSISDTKLLMESILVLLGRVMEHDVIGIYVPFEATLMVQGYDNSTLVEQFIQKVLATCGQPCDQQQRDAAEESEISIVFKETGATSSTTGATTLADFEAISMVTVGGLVGIIAAGTASAKGFSQEDKDIFRTIAGQASILLDNARLYTEMTKAANTDGLTKTFNHRSLQERLEQEFSRARRYGTALSLIMLDIDNFKSFNDTYGHQQGDLLLSEVARLLREAIRQGDIVARYGGEEFALILPETAQEGAFILAERIRQRIEEDTFPSAQGPLRITVSLGVAALAPDMRDKGALIRSSDEALYSAKRTGRNRVCVA